MAYAPRWSVLAERSRVGSSAATICTTASCNGRMATLSNTTPITRAIGTGGVTGLATGATGVTGADFTGALSGGPPRPLRPLDCATIPLGSSMPPAARAPANNSVFVRSLMLVRSRFHTFVPRRHLRLLLWSAVNSATLTVTHSARTAAQSRTPVCEEVRPGISRTTAPRVRRSCLGYQGMVYPVTPRICDYKSLIPRCARNRHVLTAIY